MKSISLPLVAKAGGGAVAASGVIAGGILLHKHFEFPKGLDKELINEQEATLSFSNEDSFATVTDKNSEVKSVIKVTSTKSDSKFTGEKWTCTIRGIAKEEGSTALDLSQDTFFSKTEQKTKFENKLTTHKYGFVKSCAKNRSSIPADTENWTSEIIVDLKKSSTGEESSRKYEFSDEDVDSIFAGTWVNPETK